MPLSKKYYNAVVKVLCETDASTRTIEGFIDYFALDNPRFNESKFRSAIGRCKRR